MTSVAHLTAQMLWVTGATSHTNYVVIAFDLSFTMCNELMSCYRQQRVSRPSSSRSTWIQSQDALYDMPGSISTSDSNAITDKLNPSTNYWDQNVYIDGQLVSSISTSRTPLIMDNFLNSY
jgi:hypothetical protein